MNNNCNAHIGNGIDVTCGFKYSVQDSMKVKYLKNNMVFSR